MGQGAPPLPVQRPQPLRSHPPGPQWPSQGCGSAPQPADRYNYAKLQQQPARGKHGKHASAEAQRLLEPGAGAAEAAEAEVAAAAAVEPGDALASLPPGLRAALEFAMERLVRWGLADAVFLTASLASSLPLNLAMYVVSQRNTEQPNPNPNPNPNPSPSPSPNPNPNPDP